MPRPRRPRTTSLSASTKSIRFPTRCPKSPFPPNICDAAGNARITALLIAARLAPSSGEAKRLVQQGGVSIDSVKITDPAQTVLVQTGQIVKVGRNRFARLIAPVGA